MLLVMENLKFLKDGSITELDPDAIERMGKPLHLPTPPSLTLRHPNMNGGNISEQMIQRRGAWAHLGSNWRAFVESKGSRLVLFTKNFHKAVKTNKVGGYVAKYSPGRTAAKAGNFFLYSQMLKLWNPEFNCWQELKYVGFASCMSLQYASQHPSYTNQISSANYAAATFSFQERKGRHPLNAYGNGPDSLRYERKTWERYQTLQLDPKSLKTEPALLRLLGRLEDLHATPQGMKLQRIKTLFEGKRQDLVLLQNLLKDRQNNLKLHQEQLEMRLKELAVIQNSITEIRTPMAECESDIRKNQPIVLKKERMLEKMKIGVLKKEAEFQTVRAAIQTEQTGDETESYAANMARSGLIIDDVIYQRKSRPNSRGISGRRTHSVIGHPEWRMVKVLMHTTRPIKMHFGLTDIDQPARASGPHRIIADYNGGSPQLTVSLMEPWGACGWEGNRFKPYPHVAGLIIDLTLSAEEIGSLMVGYAPSLCMGELGASAAAAFNDSNPKFLALSVLNYLQSVNPTDTWGKSYKSFPLWKEVENARIGKFKRLPAGHDDNRTLYISKHHTRFMSMKKKGYRTQIFFGDLGLVDGVLAPVSMAMDSRLESDYMKEMYVNRLGSRDWKLTKNFSIATGQAACIALPDPNWNPIDPFTPPFETTLQM